MASGLYNITIDQGTDYSTNMVISGQSLDGYTGRGQVRPFAGSDTLSAEFNITITGATSNGGNILAELAAEDTKTMTAGTYFYDIEIFNSSLNNTVRLLRGNVVVIGGVTQS